MGDIDPPTTWCGTAEGPMKSGHRGKRPFYAFFLRWYQVL